MADRYGSTLQTLQAIRSLTTQGRPIPNELKKAFERELDASRRDERVQLGNAPSTDYPMVETEITPGGGIESLMGRTRMGSVPRLDPDVRASRRGPNADTLAGVNALLADPLAAEPAWPLPTDVAPLADIEIPQEGLRDVAADKGIGGIDTLGASLGKNPLQDAVDTSIEPEWRRRQREGVLSELRPGKFAEPFVELGKTIPGKLRKLIPTDYETGVPSDPNTGNPLDPAMGGFDVPASSDPPIVRPSGDSPSEGGGRFGGTGLGEPLPRDPAVDPTTPPVVAPVPSADEPPDLTLPAMTSDGSVDTPLGAMTPNQMDEYFRSRFPDLDFSNPAQAKADANARRGLERDAMLAQLAIAGGLLSGAGKSWEGLGKGFTAAAGVYDKGFDRYQASLQDAADRYGKQSEQRQAREFALAGASLDAYTKFAIEDRADQRSTLKAIHDRAWDRLKLDTESKRADRTALMKQIEDGYKPFFDAVKPSEGALPDDAAEIEKEKKRNDLSTLAERSLRDGKYYPPNSLYDVRGSK